MSTVKVEQVADYILQLVPRHHGDLISNLKLQKLLYYCQGIHLGEYDKPMFENSIKRWYCGPVVERIFYKYDGYESIPSPFPEQKVKLSHEKRTLITDVWEEFGQYSAWRLMESVKREPPWRDTILDEEITHYSMHKYFHRYSHRYF